MYLASHGEEVIGYNYDDSQKIIWDLIDYCAQDKYKYTINWESKGDLVMVFLELAKANISGTIVLSCTKPQATGKIQSIEGICVVLVTSTRVHKHGGQMIRVNQ